MGAERGGEMSVINWKEEKRAALRAMRRAIPHLERAGFELDEYHCPGMDCEVCPLFAKGQPHLNVCLALATRRMLAYIADFRRLNGDWRVGDE